MTSGPDPRATAASAAEHETPHPAAGTASFALGSIEADLENSPPAASLMARLRAIEPQISNSRDRARHLRLRGVVLNRLGLYQDALGDLLEALGMESDAGERAAIWLAIADIHAWRGDARAAAIALLRALAESDDEACRARVLIDAGRLNLEIGRREDAGVFLIRGLAVGRSVLPPIRLRRATIALGDALARSSAPETAAPVLDEVLADAGLEPRLRHVASLAAARGALKTGDLASARARLLTVAALLPADPAAFEHVETLEVEAELAVADGRPDEALTAIRKVVARCAEDDLAGREVEARFLEARVLGDLGRLDEAGRTLAAALRRAEARGLAGYAESAREKLSEHDSPAWNADAPPAVPGTRDGGRFVRRRPLGRGGAGSVSRAYDLETGTEVALKDLQLGAIYETDARALRIDGARREAEAASRIRHPGIGRVFGVLTEADGSVLLVRELIEGPTLRSRMAEAVGAKEAAGILAHLGHALAAVHAADLVHGDLKPENVVLRQGGTPVIIDFGISVREGGAARPGAYTPGYAAPEQIAGARIDHRADLYSLGAIAHELALGRLPDAPPAGIWNWRARRRLAARQRADLGRVWPPEAAAMVSAALAFRSGARPGSAADFAAALGAAA